MKFSKEYCCCSDLLEIVTYIVVSYDRPNTFAKVPCGHNLKILCHEKGLIVLYPGGSHESSINTDDGQKWSNYLG